MRKPNEQNERMKRRYTHYMREAKSLSEASIDKALAAIDRYERSIKRQDFKRFHTEKAIAFKAALAAEMHPKTGKPLAKGTITTILKAVRAFHLWLADQPGYRAPIKYSDADYFNPSGRDRRIAKVGEQRPSPSLDQALYVLDQMPSATAIQKRDRAILAFLVLTGIRDGAAIGLKLRHVDLYSCTIRQDPREVNTKFSKAMTTSFFPVGGSAEAIFTAYVGYLRDTLLRSPDDPLFPKTRIERVEGKGFSATGLSRAHWADAASMRRIVKEAFTGQGMPAYGPHSFRKTLARLGEQICTTPEEMKAWSQNLGHEDVMTTFRAYGQVQDDRQAAIMMSLQSRPSRL